MPFEGSVPPPPSDTTLRRWLSSYLVYVARVLRGAGTPSAELDDAVQRTFIVAARRQGDVRDGAERSFLFQIALNVAAHARRSAARRREVPVSELPEREDPRTPEHLVSLGRDRQLLTRIIADLPPELRDVFVRVELDEHTMAEVAEQLSIPPGTVASRLRRARSLCRERLRGVLGVALVAGELLRVAKAEAKLSLLGGAKATTAVAAMGLACVTPIALFALSPAGAAQAVNAAPPAAAALPAAHPPAAPAAPPGAREPAPPGCPAEVGVAPPPRAPSSAELLRVELSRLDAARRELSSGRSERALQLLEAYDRATPRGALKLEAEVLRIDALSRSGRMDQARERAQRFLARHPNSVLAARVRRIAGG